ncbi:GATA zinc finger domain-containing protein 14-like, partial [Phymastichus coffea]
MLGKIFIFALFGSSCLLASSKAEENDENSRDLNVEVNSPKLDAQLDWFNKVGQTVKNASEDLEKPFKTAHNDICNFTDQGQKLCGQSKDKFEEFNVKLADTITEYQVTALKKSIKDLTKVHEYLNNQLDAVQKRSSRSIGSNVQNNINGQTGDVIPDSSHSASQDNKLLIAVRDIDSSGTNNGNHQVQSVSPKGINKLEDIVDNLTPKVQGAIKNGINTANQIGNVLPDGSLVISGGSNLLNDARYAANSGINNVGYQVQAGIQKGINDLGYVVNTIRPTVQAGINNGFNTASQIGNVLPDGSIILSGNSNLRNVAEDTANSGINNVGHQVQTGIQKGINELGNVVGNVGHTVQDGIKNGINTAGQIGNVLPDGSIILSGNSNLPNVAEDTANRGINNVGHQVQPWIQKGINDLGYVVGTIRPTVQAGINNGFNTASQIGNVLPDGSIILSGNNNSPNNMQHTDSHENDNVGHNVHDNIHKRIHEVGNAVHNVGHQIHDGIHERIHKVGDAVHNVAHEVHDGIHDRVHDLKNVIGNVGHNIHEQIHDRLHALKNVVDN